MRAGLRAAIIAVGKKMIETAPFPPIDRNIKSLLMSLDAAYRLNAEGPNIGGLIGHGSMPLSLRSSSSAS